jgi:hypothetical protein
MNSFFSLLLCLNIVQLVHTLFHAVANGTTVGKNMNNRNNDMALKKYKSVDIARKLKNKGNKQ